MRDIRGPRLERGEVGDVHDCPALRGPVPVCCDRREKRRPRVDGERRVPFGRRDGLDRGSLHDRRGIHQHIEPAERASDFIDERGWRRRHAEVGLEQRCLGAKPLNLRGRFARALGRAVVVDGDVHAALTERGRNRAAYPASRARDEPNAIREIHPPKRYANVPALRRTSTLASFCSSHDTGTRMTPSTRGPSTAPCQSEPPLGTSPKNSASAASRFVSSCVCPGCRTATPSSPRATNRSIVSRRPSGPGCATTARPPPAWTSAMASPTDSRCLATYAG